MPPLGVEPRWPRGPRQPKCRVSACSTTGAKALRRRRAYAEQQENYCLTGGGLGYKLNVECEVMASFPTLGRISIPEILSQLVL